MSLGELRKRFQIFGILLSFVRLAEKGLRFLVLNREISYLALWPVKCKLNVCHGYLLLDYNNFSLLKLVAGHQFSSG